MTWVGTRTDDAGSIHVVFCDVCRSVRIDSRTPGRKSWTVTYAREGPFRPASRSRRHPPVRPLARTLSERLRLLFDVPLNPHRAR